MFEIGNSLREARLRQGFELSRAEAATKIRARYLQALEEERFDLLPAESYVKGFLRTYADHLGLDGQLYVDEFNSRFTSSGDELFFAPAAPYRDHRRRFESSVVLIVLAGILAVTVLVVLAWRFAASEGAAPGRSGSLVTGM